MDELKRWLRYYGKGSYAMRLLINVHTFEPYWKTRFTDADTAFWAKMKFG